MKKLILSIALLFTAIICNAQTKALHFSGTISNVIKMNQTDTIICTIKVDKFMNNIQYSNNMDDTLKLTINHSQQSDSDIDTIKIYTLGYLTFKDIDKIILNSNNTFIWKFVANHNINQIGYMDMYLTDSRMPIAYKYILINSSKTTSINEDILEYNEDIIYYDIKGNIIIPIESGIYIKETNNSRQKVFLNK